MFPKYLTFQNDINLSRVRFNKKIHHAELDFNFQLHTWSKCLLKFMCCSVTFTLHYYSTARKLLKGHRPKIDFWRSLYTHHLKVHSFSFLILSEPTNDRLFIEAFSNRSFLLYQTNKSLLISLLPACVWISAVRR